MCFKFADMVLCDTCFGWHYFYFINNFNKVVESTKLMNFMTKNTQSFYAPTFFHGWPYAQHAWYNQFNNTEILPNNNLNFADLIQRKKVISYVNFVSTDIAAWVRLISLNPLLSLLLILKRHSNAYELILPMVFSIVQISWRRWYPEKIIFFCTNVENPLGSTNCIESSTCSWSTSYAMPVYHV